MTRIAAKLLILIALLAMPLGMSAAPANEAMEHEAMSHCADTEPKKGEAKPGIAACTMVCSAALPAIGPVAEMPQSVADVPRPALPLKRLAGILLETATPPPRAA